MQFEHSFIDYLTVNGFKMNPNDGPDCYFFSNGKNSVFIRRDKVSFWQDVSNPSDTIPDMKRIGEVTGLSNIDIFGWQLILHAYSIVPLRDYVNRVRREEPSLFQQLGEILRPQTV